MHTALSGALAHHALLASRGLRGRGTGLPVSDAVRAVAMLAATYFVVDALLGVVVARRVDGSAQRAVQDMRIVAARAPVLAGLFLALRLEGLRENRDLPLFARVAMEAAVVCLWLACLRAGARYTEDKWPRYTRSVLLLGDVAAWATALAGGAAAGLGGARQCAAVLAAASLLVAALHELWSEQARLLALVRHTLQPAGMAIVALLATELQLEGLGTREPVPAARLSMRVLTASLLLAAGLVLAAPAFGAVQEGRLRLDPSHRARALLFQVCGCGCTVVTLGSLGVLVATLCALPKAPRSLSATILCLLVLCALYLGVYIALFARAVLRSEAAWLVSAQRGVEAAPMLGALFVAARTRALVLGGHGPPGWCQDAMALATAGTALAVVCGRIRWVALLATGIQYAGVLGVLGAVATMTRATATGEGSQLAALFR